MVAIEHPEVIEGSTRSIAMDVPDSEEAANDGSINNNSAASDQMEESGLGEAGVKSRYHSITNRRGGRGVAGCKIFFSSVLYVEIFLLTHTGI